MDTVSPTKRGVVESLASGFNTLNRHLVLLAPPILVDLLLWKIAKLSPKPLVDMALAWYHDLLMTPSPTNPNVASGQTAVLYEQLQQLWEGTNLLGILAVQLPALLRFGVPGDNQWISVAVEGWPTLIFSGIVLCITGLLLTSLYLTPLAFALTGRPVAASPLMFDRAGSGWARLVSFFGIIVAASILAIPVGATALSVVSLVSPAAGALVGLFFLAAIIWVLFYLFFAQSAIFVSDASPTEAIRLSFMVVRQNFWPAFSLVVLVNILLLGTRIIWGLIMGSPLGMVGAILGNAYIATGLTVGAMVFYQDRSPLSTQRDLATQ